MSRRKRVRTAYAPRDAPEVDGGRTLAAVFALYPPAPIVGAIVINKEEAPCAQRIAPSNTGRT
jgi:hypothetical protein